MSQGAVYTGLAINQAQTRLYAANGAEPAASTCSTVPSNPANLGVHAFETPAKIAARHLVPFNVRDISGDVYVTVCACRARGPDKGRRGRRSGGGIQ